MRKLLFLLILPIVAVLTMGASSSAAAMTTDVAAVQIQAAPAAGSVLSVPAAWDDGCGGCGNVGDYDTAKRDEQYAKSWYLPNNRWSDMSMHSRVDWFNPILAGNIVGSRAIQGTLLNVGNGIWGTAADWVRSSTSFEPMNGMLGYQIDKVAAIIGTQLQQNPILFAGLFAFLIAVAVWRAMRRPGTKPFGKIIQGAIVFALITFMATQATASTAGAMSSTYNPIKGTPVWFASTITKTIDVAAGGVVSGVTMGLVSIGEGSVGGAPTAGWGCSRMTWAGIENASQNGGASPGTKAVTTSMNAMWVRMSLASYASMQFGDSNPYAKEVACHQLERTTSADGFTRSRMLNMAMNGQGTYNLSNVGLVHYNQPLLQSTDDNDTNDRVMIGLAACQPSNDGKSFSVRSGWAYQKDGETTKPWITPDDCAKLWSAKDKGEVNAIGNLNLNNVDDARNKTDDARVLNFVGTLQGSDAVISAAGITVGVMFIVGAFLVAIIFGLLGLAVFAAKIGMLFLIAGMFIMLLFTMFRRESLGQTMKSPLQRFLGISLFAFGSTLLLGLIATISLIFAALATLFGPDGTPGNLMFVALSPLGAVIAVHMLFTKVLKMPSPVTPTGALAWGTVGAAAGGAVAAGIGSKMTNAASRTAGRLGKEALGSSKATSWMVGKEHRANQERRGAGDAGRRRDLGTGGVNKQVAGNASEVQRKGADIASTALSGAGAVAGTAGALTGAAAGKGRSGADAAGKGGVLGDATLEAAQAAHAAAEKATEGMSEAEVRSLEKEARKADRAENPNALARGIGNLKAKLAQRNDARAVALLEGSDYEETEELLSPEGKERLSMVNRDQGTLEGLEEGTTPGTIGAITWADLSTKGKVEAANRAAAVRREARQTERVEHKETRANLRAERKETRATLRAERKEVREEKREQLADLRTKSTLGDRNLARVASLQHSVNLKRKAATTAVGNAASTVGRKVVETKEKVEVKALQAQDRVASLATKEGRMEARDAVLTAARTAPYAAAAGVKKTREVAQRGREFMASGAGKATVAAVGVGIAAAGNPIVGGVIAVKAAKEGTRILRENRAQKRLVRQTAQLEYIAAAALKRTAEAAPRTSMVSPAEPIAPATRN